MRGEPSLADRFAATFEEAALSLWRRRPFVIATVASVAATLAFPAALVLVLGWTRDLVGDMASRERLRVFVFDDVSPGEVAAIRRALESSSGIDRVEVVPADRARAEFLERFPDLAPVVETLGKEAFTLPASVEAWGDGAPATLDGAARRVAGMPGVEEIRHDAEAATRMARLRASLAAVSSMIAAIALMVTGVGIGNVIRMGALARREQLAVMRLVGAPRFHVRAPFVLEGLVQGALGGALAAAGLAATRWLVASSLASALPASAAGLGSGAILALVAAPGIVGAATAAWAVESVLRHHARLER